MKQFYILSGFLFFLTSCATAPKTCTPLTSGFDLVSSYEGECLRLAYHGEDLNAKCSNILLVYERKKTRQHSILFKTRGPRGVVSFNGVPHRKTSKIYYVKVANVLRAEKAHEVTATTSNISAHQDTGVCDVEILPGENIRVICSANDAEGKMSTGEFKTTSRKVISCMEQYPDYQANK